MLIQSFLIWGSGIGLAVGVVVTVADFVPHCYVPFFLFYFSHTRNHKCNVLSVSMFLLTQNIIEILEQHLWFIWHITTLINNLKDFVSGNLETRLSNDIISWIYVYVRIHILLIYNLLLTYFQKCKLHHPPRHHKPKLTLHAVW